MTAKVIAIKSTPAAKSAKKDGAVTLSAKERKEQLSAAVAAAQSRPVTELVEEYHLSEAGAISAQSNSEKLLSMLEASKVEASNHRVVRSRLAYQIATHPAVATKRHPVNVSGASRVITAKPGLTDKEHSALAEKYRTTLQHTVKAGEALHAKGMAYLTGTPTEGERAVVEGSLDKTLRAKSARNNAKQAAKLAEAKRLKEAAKLAAKGAKGAKGPEAPAPAPAPADLPDGITPAEVLKAARAVLAMVSGMTAAGTEYSQVEADALADVLAEIESVVAGSVPE